MREVLGWNVTAPVMSGLGWDIESQTEVLVREIDAFNYDLVIGSSMGGLAAANASSLREDSDFRLLLIAPAFGLSEAFEKRLSEQEMSEWKDSGTWRYLGFELDLNLEWKFMEAAERMSWPIPRHTTTIVHGERDDVVPIDVSRRVAGGSKLVELLEIGDGHRMKMCLPILADLASELLSRES